MTDEEKDYFKKVNIDKAIKKTTVPIILIIVSILTYILPLVFGEFDFGIIFEIISLVFLIIARSHMKKYDEIRAKRSIIVSMLSMGWILIYDLILFCSYIQDALDLALLGFDYYIAEFFSLIYLIILFKINKDLSKAENPIKYKESTDWFYENGEKDIESPKKGNIPQD